MNTRSTWWLVGTAVALFAFILLVERRHSQSDQPVGPQRLFQELVPSQVTRIDVISSGETMRAERTSQAWRLTSPVAYPAQSPAINAFLESCTKLAARTTIPMDDIASQPRGLADYGLQPPAATISIHQGSRTFNLHLGTNTLLGESIYVQTGKDENVKVIDTAMVELFPRTVAEWRDRSLLNLEGVAFNRLEVRTGTRGFAVERDPYSLIWQMTKPPPAKRADNQKIGLIVREIQNWHVQQFVTDNPAAAAEPFGLQPPAAELIIGQGTNDLISVQFGGSPSNAPQLVFARRMSNTNIVLVPTNWLGVLTRHLSDFRDHRLLTFNATNSTRIEMRGLFNFIVQRQTNGAWRVGEPFNFPADTGLVEDLLARLQGLEIVEFEKDVVSDTDLATYGLVTPQLRVIVSAPATNAIPGVTNTILADLLIGTNRQLSSLYAKRSDEASVYVVPLAEIQRVPQNPFALRDRNLWSFGTSNVVSVTTFAGGQTRKLLREAGGDWQFAPGYQGSFEPVAVEEMIHRLGSTKAITWTARGASQLPRYGIAPETGTSIEVQVRTAEGVSTNRVDFGRLSAARRPYASTTVDGEPMVFEFDAALYENLIQFLFPRQP